MAALIDTSILRQGVPLEDRGKSAVSMGVSGRTRCCQAHSHTR